MKQFSLLLRYCVKKLAQNYSLKPFWRFSQPSSVLGREVTASRSKGEKSAVPPTATINWWLWYKRRSSTVVTYEHSALVSALRWRKRFTWNLWEIMISINFWSVLVWTPDWGILNKLHLKSLPLLENSWRWCYALFWKENLRLPWS